MDISACNNIFEEKGYLVVFIPSQNGKPVIEGDLLEFDRRENQRLSEFLTKTGFDAAFAKTLIYQSKSADCPAFIICVGIGQTAKLNISKWLDVSAISSRFVQNLKIQDAGFVVPSYPKNLEDGYLSTAIIRGLILGSYKFNNYKSKDNNTGSLEQIRLYNTANTKDLNKIINNAITSTDAVNIARNLVNEPSTVTTPKYLADYALNLSKKYPDIKVEIYSRSEIDRLGMGGLLGVSRGSDEEPYFIHLSFGNSIDKTLVLVGKGITFDSGGLSLKPGGSMETMKMDMAAAASILGLFSVLPKMKINYRIEGLIGATENMPSGKAMKPGDILKMLNGTTVEVVNTDAEGRLILADLLSYAYSKLDKIPDYVIDIATLTGACMVALGEEVAGLFSNSNQLGDMILAAAAKSGEKIWRLPLVENYNELLKSPIADLKNVTKSKYGGAITAGLFLQSFVPDDSRWAHLDIAGPAFAEKDMPLSVHGGTGFGVLTLVDLISS